MLLAIAIYVPAMDGPFVWDDRLLLETPQIAELKPWPDYFRQPFWQITETGAAPALGQGAYYRPLSTLSLAVDRQLHGDNPTGFHLLGLFLHGINTALVLSLARRLGAGLPAALLGALLFAWFPRLSESVAWISGRTDVMAATFALGALALTLGSWRPRRFASAVCILLGAFCKEVALAAAIGVVFWEWQSDESNQAGQRWRRVFPTLLAAAIYLAMRTWVLADSEQKSPITLAVRLLASLEAVARYAYMLVDGWQPRLQIGYLAQPNRSLAIVGALLLPVPFFALLKLRAERAERMLLLVAFSALGMVLHLVPIQGKVIAADRFLYLPVALLGVLVASWLAKTSRVRASIAVFLLLLSYAPATWQRAGVWGDDIAFWGTAVSERTTNLNAHARLGLGNLLAEHGMHREALHQYSQAKRGDARSWMLCQYNSAGLLAMNGEFDAAISILERARREAPSVAQLERLALLHASKGEEAQALALVRKYEADSSDPRQAEQLEAKVRATTRLMPEVLRARHTLSEKLAQARGYAEVGLFRLAMSELVSLASHPGITPAHLQGMLSSALEHGTPEQLLVVQARLDALGVGYPPAYVQLLAERHARVGRLREWIRKTDRP